MKRTAIFLMLWMFAVGGQAQTVFRYWFDGNTSSIHTVTATTPFLQMDVGNLYPGFHTAYFMLRHQDSSHWAQQQSFFFYRIDTTTIPRPDTIECWFDADYSQKQSGLASSGIIELDLDGLYAGFHTFYMRIGDELCTSLFYKLPSPIEILPDSTYSYWFDADDSHRYSGTLNEGMIEVVLDDIREGFHVLYLRAGGELRTSLFYKLPPQDTTLNDSTFTYWFDEGSEAAGRGLVSNGVATINVEDLSDTTHIVYLMIGSGKTGQLFSSEFQKVPVVYTVTLATSDSTMGSVSGEGNYPRNSTTSIAATANYGYHFHHWSDGDTNALRTLTLVSDTSLTAYFVPDTFSFNLTVSDSTMGSVTLTGTSEYLGTDTATAIPNYGYHFIGWSDGDTANPRVVTMTQDTIMTALFAPNIYTVTLSSTTPEWGSVIGSGEYPYQTTVQAEAVAVYGYQFKRWTDGDTRNPRPLVVRCDTSLTAEFELRRYSLTVNSNDLTRGFTQGGGTFTVFDTATAMAVTLAGNSFLGWTDGSMANPRQIQLQSDTTLTAIFHPLENAPETIIVHDTSYVPVHDTTVVNVEIHDTSYVNITVHDTTYITLIDTVTIVTHDTAFVNIEVPVHDTTYVEVFVHDTTFIVQTDTGYVNITVHDTTYITLIDTVTVTIHDTTVVTHTEYVPIHDTTYIALIDTVTLTVHDTTVVTQTEYVPVHDTTVVTLTDTVTLTEYVPVHDTTVITLTDTVTNTVYDTVTNTVYDTVTNTEYVYDTVTNIDTIAIVVHDTTLVTLTDTLWLTQTDTLWLYDTIIIHDTIVIHDTIFVNPEGIGDVEGTRAKIYQSNGQIVVDGADGQTVTLYDVTGRILATKRDEYAPLHFSIHTSGTYLIKIGSLPARRVVVIR